MPKTTTDATPPPAKPLFAQVESSLREDILQNRLPPGAKLPSESELEASFGVSRITIRQALSALGAQGLIEKLNGKGSFVTRPADAPRLGPLTGFYEHIRSRGDVASGRTLSVREVPAGAAAAEALKLAPGTPLTLITIVRMVNGEPMAYGTLHAEPALARALLAHDLDVNDVMSVLESSLGYRLKSTHIEAGAVAAGKLRARLLEVAEADPLLRIRFTPHDVSDKPLTYSEMFFRADRFNYRAVVKR
ncbi:GntR family transcriptional regulator [Pseudorhodoferax sp.]|uniref:GntR family transcriptional regulator n=1 Tax=Pseudorhodoferax sp. TaxID=1993553 RepID=UPI002DD666D7|nr:GntR family transcriptional regulator [Pseudorhodoferax sp.]